MATNELDRLSAAIERHAPLDGVCDTAVPGLLLGRQRAPTDPVALVVGPSLCIVAQGAKEVFLAGEKFRYDPIHSLLVSVDLPMSVRVAEASATRPCLAVRVCLDLSVVAEMLVDCPDTPPHGPPGRGLEVSPIDAQLLDAVARMVALLDSPRTIPPLSPLVLREITYRVLIGPQGARLRQVAAAGAPVRWIADSIHWMRDNFAAELRVEALALHARMSLSGFHRHFKAVTGISPIQYQKRLRLEEARRLMMDQGLGATEAAFQVGYESATQFSREYRRMFGNSPRRDVVAHKLEAQPLSSSGG